MIKSRTLLAASIFVAMGIPAVAFAQYGDSPGSSRVLEGFPGQERSNAGKSSVDDATITARVKAALGANSRLNVTNVNVQTNQGSVQLVGTVDSKNQRDEAENIVNRVDGVRSVQDLLKVKEAQEQ